VRRCDCCSKVGEETEEGWGQPRSKNLANWNDQKISKNVSKDQSQVRMVKHSTESRVNAITVLEEIVCWVGQLHSPEVA
jgi:hypothetical protein